jgi:hypothetical protein
LQFDFDEIFFSRWQLNLQLKLMVLLFLFACFPP